METKKCKFCAEEIKVEARICKFCNREQESNQSNPAILETQEKKKVFTPLRIIILVIILLMLKPVYDFVVANLATATQ